MVVTTPATLSVLVLGLIITSRGLLLLLVTVAAPAPAVVAVAVMVVLITPRMGVLGVIKIPRLAVVVGPCDQAAAAWVVL